MKPWKVGIDSYCLKPLNLTPFEVLDWAVMNGADGVQFSEGGLPPASELADRAFLHELRSYSGENRLYLEWGGAQHIPVDLETGKAADIFAVNRRAASEARELGVTTIRSCSGGLMRWKREGPSTDDYLKLAAGALKEQRTMLRDAGVVLAIETHFEFTSFELLRLFEMCGATPGDYLGVCLDTMNLLTMLEDPVSAAERLLPWVVTTHIKDGGLLLGKRGLVSFTAEAGTGAVDIAAILRLLAAVPRKITLSLEDHGGDFAIPVFDPAFLARFPDVGPAEMIRLLKVVSATQALVDDRKIKTLSRERWPEVCERRVKRGLKNLRRIAQEVQG